MDPLIISMLISAALSAYSTQQQASATNKIQTEQAAALAAERQRQAALDREREAAVAETRPAFTPETQNEAQKTIAQNLQEYLAPVNQKTAGEAEYATAANPGAPKEVADAGARALSGAVAKGADYAKSLAQFSALKNLNFGNALAMGRLGTDVGQLNLASKRSADVLPFELEAAKAAGNAAMTRAAAAQGLSSITAMYGASQFGKVPTPVPEANVGGGLQIPTGTTGELQIPGGSSIGYKPSPTVFGSVGYNPFALRM